MPDEPALRRQWLLLKALSARRLGLTVRAIVDETGVGAKTVRRDLVLFRSLGFPLEEEVGPFGRKTWRIASYFGQPPLSFTLDEVVALHLGRRLLGPLAATPFGAAAGRAFQKVRAALGQPALDYLERFQPLFHPTAFGAGDYSGKTDLIDALLLAAEDGKAVHVLYQSERATEPAYRDVYPYGHVYHKGSLYLVALDPREEKVKHYKIDRVEAVEVSTFPFRRPADFDLARHLADALGIYHGDGPPTLYRVRFAPSVARYVRESAWHPSQRLSPQRDGGLVAEFRLSCSEELKSWILSFGPKAVVLEPESLRQALAADLRAALKAYAPAPLVGGGVRQ